MPDMDDDARRRRLGLPGLGFFSIGLVTVAVTGSRLVSLAHPWASNSNHWLGLFIGIMFAGMGGLLVWDWLFAPPLTPEQRRFREMNEDWQRERRRMGGGDRSWPTSDGSDGGGTGQP